MGFQVLAINCFLAYGIESSKASMGQGKNSGREAAYIMVGCERVGWVRVRHELTRQGMGIGGGVRPAIVRGRTLTKELTKFTLTYYLSFTLLLLLL